MSGENMSRHSEMIIHTFDAMSLPNEVIWASDFAAEKLGLKAMSEYTGSLFLWEPGQKANGKFGARRFHHRSFNVDVPSQDGGAPVHVSLKGAGYFNGSGVEEWHDTYFHRMGLMSLEACFAEMTNSKKLKALNVRTVEPVAIVRLKALPVRTYGGHTHIVPIEVIKATGRIQDAEFEPGVFFRKGMSDTRMEDTLPLENEDENLPNESLRKELGHVLGTLKSELGLELTPHKYLEWMADIIGRNIGKMHAAGIVHRYIHPGNITLAGELIDNADFEEFSLPDMNKPVIFGDMHEMLKIAEKTQDTLALIDRDIGQKADEDSELGAWPIIFKFANVMLATFPDSFRHDLDEWRGNSLEYYFNQLCPELDDAFWRAYLEEVPQHAFLHSGFQFPRQGEKGRDR